MDSRESLLACLDSITDGVMILDTEWRVRYINRTGARFTGRTPEALLGLNFWDEYPAAREHEIYAHVLRVVERQQPERLEVYYAPNDLWLEHDLYPAEDRVVSIFRDITDRKRAEEERETLLAQAEAARIETDALARELHEQRQVVEANNEELRAANEELIERQQALEALRAEAEVVARVGRSLVSELDLDRLVQAITDAATGLADAEFGALFYNVRNENGEAYTLYSLAGVPREKFAQFPMPRNTHIFAPTFAGEGVVRLADVTRDPRYGQNAPYQGMPAGHLPVRSYLAVPVVARSGEVLGGLFFGHSQPGRFREEHERIVVGIAGQAAVAIDNARLFQQLRDTESALRSQQQFRLAIENSMAAGVAAIDRDGKQNYVNPAFCRLVGWSAEELLGGTPPFLYWPPEEHARIFEMFHGVLAGDIPSAGLVMKQRRKDESRFDALVFPAPLRDARGEIDGWLIVISDITERKRSEAERERLLAREQAAHATAEAARLRAEALAAELAQERDRLAGMNAELEATVQRLETTSRALAAEQDEQQTSARWLRAANRATARLVTQEEEAALVQVVSEAIHREMGAFGGGVWLCSTPKKLQSRIIFGLAQDRPTLPDEFNIDLHPYKVAWVARYAKPFIGAIDPTDLQFDQGWVRRNGLRAAALLPLRGREQMHGVVVGYWREPLPLAAGEVLTGLVSALAGALDNLALRRRLEDRATGEGERDAHASPPNTGK